MLVLLFILYLTIVSTNGTKLKGSYEAFDLKGNNQKSENVIDIIKENATNVALLKKRCNQFTTDFRKSCDSDMFNMTLDMDLAEKICKSISINVAKKDSTDFIPKLTLQQIIDQEVEFYDSITTIRSAGQKYATMCVFDKAENNSNKLYGNENKYQIVYLLQGRVSQMKIKTRHPSKDAAELNRNLNSRTRSKNEILNDIRRGIVNSQTQNLPKSQTRSNKSGSSSDIQTKTTNYRKITNKNDELFFSKRTKNSSVEILSNKSPSEESIPADSDNRSSTERTKPQTSVRDLIYSELEKGSPNWELGSVSNPYSQDNKNKNKSVDYTEYSDVNQNMKKQENVTKNPSQKEKIFRSRSVSDFKEFTKTQEEKKTTRSGLLLSESKKSKINRSESQNSSDFNEISNGKILREIQDNKNQSKSGLQNILTKAKNTVAKSRDSIDSIENIENEKTPTKSGLQNVITNVNYIRHKVFSTQKPVKNVEGNENRKPVKNVEGNENRKPVKNVEGNENRKPVKNVEGNENRKPVKNVEGNENRKPVKNVEWNENRKPVKNVEGNENRKPPKKSLNNPELFEKAPAHLLAMVPVRNRILSVNTIFKEPVRGGIKSGPALIATNESKINSERKTSNSDALETSNLSATGQSDSNGKKQIRKYPNREKKSPNLFQDSEKGRMNSEDNSHSGKGKILKKSKMSARDLQEQSHEEYAKNVIDSITSDFEKLQHNENVSEDNITAEKRVKSSRKKNSREKIKTKRASENNADLTKNEDLYCVWKDRPQTQGKTTTFEIANPGSKIGAVLDSSEARKSSTSLLPPKTPKNKIKQTLKQKYSSEPLSVEKRRISSSDHSNNSEDEWSAATERKVFIVVQSGNEVPTLAGYVDVIISQGREKLVFH